MGVFWGFTSRVVKTEDSNLLGYSFRNPPGTPHRGFLGVSEVATLAVHPLYVTINIVCHF